MKKILPILLFAALCCLSASGQESGNRNYGPAARTGGRRTPPNTGALSGGEDKEEVAHEQFIEAYVLLNAQPDEFLAVFGASQVAPTAVESNQKVNAQIEQFLAAAERLGVRRGDTFIDFITQNRVYEFSPPDNTGTIREKLSGFETKKTVAVRYKDRPALEKLIEAAANASIFDLIKVDYVINDMASIRRRLLDEAIRIVKQKEENYVHSLGLTLRRSAITTESYDTYYPYELYQTYAAFESGSVDNYYNSNTRVIRERKSSTSYLEPLDRSAFDSVLTPAGIEPVVQCTLYFKVRYSLPPLKPARTQ
jgi:uncharacterized protein YggE